MGDAVVIGNGGAEYGVRGYVTAYDAETGKRRWRTFTVPGNPADGFESEAMRAAAETWSGEWWISGGGGTAWDAMAVDNTVNLLYIGTGNGSPWSHSHRSPGGGDNLYLSSIMALDPADGSLAWHYQTTPGDDWDFTATQPLMLLDLEIGGRERRVIAQAPKNGFFYVLDRITGELISAEPFADDLTWATGVDLESGRPVETPEARYGATGKGVYLAPGPSGAHNWYPMSYSPQTGLVYLPASNNNYYWEKAAAYDHKAGRWNTGTTSGSDADRPERPELKGPANVLLAWDPADNREVWRVAADEGHGGTMTTAGNLVFWATGTRMVALDARTGRELWSAEVGRDGGSPVSYAVDGRQYVAVAAGLTTGGGAPRLSAFALDAPAGSVGQEVQEPPHHRRSRGGGTRRRGASRASDRPCGSSSTRGAPAGIMTMVARRGEIVHWDAQGVARSGRGPARAQRHLPHLLDDQAGHERRDHDARRGGRALAGRRGGRRAARLRRGSGPPGHGLPLPRPSHADPPPAHPHFRSHLRVLRHQRRRFHLQRRPERAGRGRAGTTWRSAPGSSPRCP